MKYFEINYKIFAQREMIGLKSKLGNFSQIINENVLLDKI